MSLLPPDALRSSVPDTLGRLADTLGASTVELALAWAADDATVGQRPPAALAGPVRDATDGRWLRRANLVGINVRTVGDLWGVVRYALTLPPIQDGIHLLPVLEPGVVASLYGPSSWHIDPALRSEELARHRPDLGTPERQLRAVVALLHATGRTVGIDVVPHTDRFSEMVLAQPDHFEWLERQADRIVRHGPAVVADVERWILAWLQARGPAVGGPVPTSADELFRGLDEASRLRLLFGTPEDAAGRRTRRLALIRELHPTGLETVPATMGPPYRGLEVDPSPTARIVDENGLEWRDYRITRPEPQSRVFGPLTRYALHEPRPGGDGWELDWDRPREAVWRYVTGHYAELAVRWDVDFLRGDMAHVQMRPSGVPARPPARYDILGAVRDEVRDARGVRRIAYLAETFLVPPGTMAYGDEADHLEAAGADATLGDLQSLAVDDAEFVRRLRRYRDLLDTRAFAPSFTVMTGDKDDPRFDAFYRAGNEARLFLALFLADMPSYVALGFELRDRHDRPAPNEHYTKLYVFQRGDGPNATHGPYVFGRNVELFGRLSRIRDLASELRPELALARVRWLRPPDATGAERVLAWTLEGAQDRLAVANLDVDRPAPVFSVPRTGLPEPPSGWRATFSTSSAARPADPLTGPTGWTIGDLGAGECRLYEARAG